MVVVAIRSGWSAQSDKGTVFDLLYYTAQRIGDVAEKRWRDITGDELQIRQQKTGIELSIRVHPRPWGACSTPTASAGSTSSSAASESASPPDAALGPLRSRREGRAAVRTRAKRNPPGGSCGRIAEAGTSAKVIAALSGHNSLREVERYAEKADQSRMSVSAFAALPDQQA